MRMTSDIPMHPRLLEAVLDGFVQAAQILIRAGKCPSTPYDADVTWKLEPKGEEEWCLPTDVMRKGWGDCEDMAIWLAAGYREEENDNARVRLVKTGKTRWHAIVEREDGTREDPSEVLKPRRKER